ncbi:hypothetical protein EVAR_14114_1 [Eumeta japonica]|uniref:Uncharacterized protein n=1 Tax=Eumeta variegata TaxID=151549 RepID=A0A4C1UNA0_EUMVA|nr:hypothetical protein EVAR_14114_1 [Eumeta japonica]
MSVDSLPATPDEGERSRAEQTGTSRLRTPFEPKISQMMIKCGFHIKGSAVSPSRNLHRHWRRRGPPPSAG